MTFSKEGYEDAVVRSVNGQYNLYDNEDFGITEEDLPEGNKMGNEQEVIDGVQTKKVIEERQKIVNITKINKFAILGLIVGLLIVGVGICMILNLQQNLKLDIDSRLGYVLVVMGAYMFCSFGMHVKQKEFTVETFTVEKEVPIEAIPYNE